MSPEPTNPTDPSQTNPALPEPETQPRTPGTEDDGGESLLSGQSREARPPILPDEVEQQAGPIDPPL